MSSYQITDWNIAEDGKKEITLSLVRRRNERKAGFVDVREIRDVCRRLDVGELISIKGINFGTGDLEIEVRNV